MHNNAPEDQERIHELLQDLLTTEGEVLTSWGIVFEAQGESTSFGYWHGPIGTPIWRSRGLYSQAICYIDAETIHQELHSCADPDDEDEGEPV